jgi:hypothetical protein
MGAPTGSNRYRSRVALGVPVDDWLPSLSPFSSFIAEPSTNLRAISNALRAEKGAWTEKAGTMTGRQTTQVEMPNQSFVTGTREIVELAFCAGLDDVTITEAVRDAEGATKR